MKKYFTILAILLCHNFRAAAAVPPAEKLMPDDTLMVFTVPDLTKVMEVYSNSPQLQIWSDAALKPFRDKLMGKVKTEFLAPMERDLGIHFDDYTSLPQGQVTFAVVQDGWQGKERDDKEPAMLLLVDTKDKSGQLKTNLADLKKKWVDAGKTVKTEKIRDVDFSVVTLSSNDLPKTLRKSAGSASDSGDAADKPAITVSATKSPLYIGQADSVMVLGSSSKVIEKVLAAMNGGSVKTLGDVPAFAANYNSLFRNSQAYGWVNLRLFVDVLKQSLPTPPPAAADAEPSVSPQKLIAVLGLEGLRTAAISYGVDKEGAQTTMLLGVPEDARSGIFKLLAGEAKDINPPPFVPADAVIYRRWRIDGQKVWAGIRKMVGDISASNLGALDFLLNTVESSAKEKDPDFDIKKNLFGNLGDDIVYYKKGPQGNSLADYNSAPSLFLLGSPNPTQLTGALNSLLVLSGQPSPPKEREFLGRKIYTFPLSGLPISTGAGGASPSLSYAASSGYLAISTDTAMLEEYLRSGSQDNAKMLRDTKGLGAATQKVTDSGTSLFGYSNDSETARALMNMLTKDAGQGGFADALNTYLTLMGAKGNLKDWIDLSLLPSFDQLSKYFYLTVYSGGATPEGLVFKTFSPVPPQLSK